MTRHDHDHTNHDTTPDTTTSTTGTRGTGGRSAAARVEDAMARLDLAALQVGPMPTTDTGWVSYCTTLAWISARRAGWWRVLLADQRRTHRLAPVAVRAVGIAYRRARDDARFWRESAADWQARAEQRPTSDAAGALSNWDELGVR